MTIVGVGCAGPAPGRCRPAATNDLGLTLLEMLVVLAIIGIASSAVALSLAPRGGIAVEAEARRLAGAIQAAADAAMVAGPAAALLAEPHAYTVAHAVAGRWRGARHALADGMRLDGTTAAPVRLGDGAAIDLTLTRGGEAWRIAFDGLRASASPK